MALLKAYLLGEPVCPVTSLEVQSQRFTLAVLSEPTEKLARWVMSLVTVADIGKHQIALREHQKPKETIIQTASSKEHTYF